MPSLILIVEVEDYFPVNNSLWNEFIFDIKHLNHPCMQALQLSIPKPCHEDWNQMSPREQGRFCDKCSKTVTDFSSMSSTEIQQYFLKHRDGKVCGRFRGSQLDTPIILEIPYRSIGGRLNASQVFLVSLLFVFGTTLFSCKNHNDETIGKIALIEWSSPTTNEQDTTEQTLSLTVVSVDETEKIPADSFGNLQDCATSDTAELPTVDVIGKREFYVLGGAMAVTTRIYSSPLILDSHDSSSVEKNNGEEQVIQAPMLYPNPAHQFVNLKFNVQDLKNVEAQLFDLSGKMVRTFIPMHQMESGEMDQQFAIDDLPPGAYLLRLVIGETVDTKRLVII